jgi:hypothetical protein
MSNGQISGVVIRVVGVGIMVAHDHRVAGGSHSYPAPTERSVQISRTTLVRS